MLYFVYIEVRLCYDKKMWGYHRDILRKIGLKTTTNVLLEIVHSYKINIF